LIEETKKKKERSQGFQYFANC